MRPSAVAQHIRWRLLGREEAAFASVLTAAVERGELELRHPAQAAQTLVACLHGLLMLAKMRNDLSVLP